MLLRVNVAGIGAAGEEFEAALAERLYIDLRVPDYDERIHADRVTWRILNWTTLLMRSAGLPIFEFGRVVQRLDDHLRMVAAPALPNRPRATARAVNFASRVIRQLDSVSPGKVGGSLDTLGEAVSRFRENLRPIAPSGQNTLYFQEAAWLRSIPCSRVAGSCFQYGQGARSKWLDSTFTEATGTLGTRFARQKAICATILRSAGLPVPTHRQVASEGEAIRAANSLGFPVVVKPADLDGGVAVAAGLETDKEVSQAFAEARKRSPQVIVEKHVEGEDYRLTVFRGRLIWAVHRQPGGVVGNGENSIRELLDSLNGLPSRGSDPRSALKRIEVNDEAIGMLRKQGLGLESVPAAGVFVRLRRIANVSTGGLPRPVFDRVHPDNADLAVRAADALRLDFAGVDLLIPDIGVSWLETGAAICEVNAQPQLGTTSQTHLFGEVLESLFADGARIPVHLLIGGRLADDSLPLIERKLLDHDIRFALIDGGTAQIRGTVQGPASDWHQQSLAMLGRTDVEGLVIRVSNPAQMLWGLPFDRVDGLCLDLKDSPATPRLRNHLELLLGSNAGNIAVSDRDSLSIAKVPGRADDAGAVRLCTTAAECVETMLSDRG